VSLTGGGHWPPVRSSHWFRARGRRELGVGLRRSSQAEVSSGSRERPMSARVATSTALDDTGGDPQPGDAAGIQVLRHGQLGPYPPARHRLHREHVQILGVQDRVLPGPPAFLGDQAQGSKRCSPDVLLPARSNGTSATFFAPNARAPEISGSASVVTGNSWAVASSPMSRIVVPLLVRRKEFQLPNEQDLTVTSTSGITQLLALRSGRPPAQMVRVSTVTPIPSSPEGPAFWSLVHRLRDRAAAFLSRLPRCAHRPRLTHCSGVVLARWPQSPAREDTQHN
jgi:hypothetical protein